MIVNNKNSQNSGGQRKSRGTFIVFEGVDRCGKTTQCKMLLKRLLSLGIAAVSYNFPNRTTPIGSIINSYLQSGSNLDDHAIHLLFSANRWEVVSNSLIKDLEMGKTVICDRYAYSGVCFTYAKNKLSSSSTSALTPAAAPSSTEISLDWCKSPDIGLPQPDLVLFLDLSEEESKKRAGFGEERYEKLEMQRAVRKTFHELIQSEKSNSNLWNIINAAQTIEEVEKDIFQLVEKTIHRVSNDGLPLKKLWWNGDEKDSNYEIKVGNDDLAEDDNKNSENLSDVGNIKKDKGGHHNDKLNIPGKETTEL